MVLAICFILYPVEAEPISISSNNDVYYMGDYIVVFGQIETIFENVPVTVQIYHESTLIDVDQIPVAKDGTLRVLNAGLNAGVEQIIKTSSIVAMFRKPNRSNPYSFGENDWTDVNWVEGVSDYFLSKTKAERAAWDFMESKGLKNKLTAINPGGVFGDALDKKGGTSIEYVRQFMKGKFPGAPKFAVLISDVKDIAKAHVACIGNNKVGGRRLIVGKEVKRLVELSQLMAEAMPEYAKKLPKKELPNFMVKLISYLDSSAKTMIPDLGIIMQTDTTYAEELLGFKFKPAKDCMAENAKSVVRLGLV